MENIEQKWIEFRDKIVEILQNGGRGFEINCKCHCDKHHKELIDCYKGDCQGYIINRLNYNKDCSIYIKNLFKNFYKEISKYEYLCNKYDVKYNEDECELCMKFPWNELREINID